MNTRAAHVLRTPRLPAIRLSRLSARLPKAHPDAPLRRTFAAPSSPSPLPRSQAARQQYQTKMTEPPPPPTVPEATGTLYAIADLHIGHKANADALNALAPHPTDGLIIAGDVGESLAHLRTAFAKATRCFAAVWWVPGNHELYTLPRRQTDAPTDDHHDDDDDDGATLRGHEKYMACVATARTFGIHTPEDAPVLWTGRGGPALIAPLFLLYDYSFRPAEVPLADALAWARADRGTEATDEALLHPDPYASREAWCAARVALSGARVERALAGAPAGVRTVLVNHWPLREELVWLPAIPRFSLWCGTRESEGWHVRFRAGVVVSGHLHIRRTDWIDGVRFEECSLGYPRQWEEARNAGRDVNDMLREILPGPEKLASERSTTFRKLG